MNQNQIPPPANRPALFLGLQTVTREGWEQFFSEPTAPKSYVDPAKKADYVAKEKLKRATEAHTYPVAGTISGLVILDAQGQVVYKDGPEASITGAVLAVSHYVEAFPDTIVVGLEIRAALRLILLDALHLASKLGIAFAFDQALWLPSQFDHTRVMDPYHVLINSELRGDVPVDKLCAFLGIQLPGAWDATADSQARTTLALYQVLTKK